MIDEHLTNAIACLVPQEMKMALTPPVVQTLARNTLNLVFGGNSMAELRKVNSNSQEQGVQIIFAKDNIPNGTEMEVWYDHINFLRHDFRN